MYKILLIDDDTALTGVMRRQLSKWGYIAEAVTDFGAVMEHFRRFEPHLVLLDISLPFFNGYHWCAQLRKESRTPVLFLSSSGDDMSQVMALSLGADDFVAKPFSFDLLVAKIQAILRRTYAFGAEVTTLHFGDVVLNLGDASVSLGDKRLELTKNEFRILHMLIEAKGDIVPRETVMQRLWESESFVDDNTLTVNVARLRKKLEGIGLADFIATKKGVGYYAGVRM